MAQNRMCSLLRRIKDSSAGSGSASEATIQSPPAMTLGANTMPARWRRLRRRLLEWLAVHLFGGVLLRLLVWSWRLEVAIPDSVLQALAEGRRFIIAFWHNRQIGLLKVYRQVRIPVKVMISRHGDGEIIARIVARQGVGSVRGSSTRGGSAALVELIKITAESNVAITPDGPVGPRYHLKGGVVQLASRSGREVLCVSWSANRVWRFRSWDRFLLPKPFAHLKVDTDGPIAIPKELDRESTEAAREEVEQRLNDLTARLDAEMGHEPGL